MMYNISKMTNNIKKLTDDELKMLSKELSGKYHYVLDAYEKGTSKNLIEALKAKNVEKPKSVARQICDVIEEGIIRKIRYLAHVMFYYMELSGNYQGFSWNQINESFCRIVLNFPLNKKITPKKIDEYRDTISKIRGDYGISEYFPDQLKDLLLQRNFYILEKAYPTYADQRINNLLNWLGSSKRLLSGLYGGELGYIFGEIKKRTIGDYDVYIIESEDARTPNRILPLVAVISGTQIVLRRESFRSFFYDKWMSLFEMSNITEQKILHEEKRNIQYMLQKKVLELYGAKNKNEFLKHEETFISEMMQVTLYHEYGHSLLQNEISSSDHFAIGRAMTNLGENIVTILCEFLSDFAPKKEKIKGPIQYLIDLSQRGKEKQASRMLLTYLSDKWFYGKGKEPLATMTTIFASVLISHLKKDGTFDFKGLSKARDTLYKGLLDKYEIMTSQIEKKLRGAEFTVRGQKLDFASLVEALKDLFERTDGKIDEKSPQFKNAFWHQTLIQVINYAPATYREILDYLTSMKKDILRETTTAEDPETHVVKQMKKLGFYKAVKPLSIQEIVKLGCQEFHLDSKEILQKFSKIYEGGTIDLRKAYKYKIELPHPFYTFLREALQKIKMLSYTGITFGQALENKKIIPDKEKTFRERIENMVDFLNREKAKEITIFAVEKDFLTQKRIEEILKEYTLESGQSIRDIIVHIKYLVLPHNYLFEIYVPSKPDALDSTIVQAVWKMNQKFRPTEKNNQFILDKTLLEKICQEYLKV